ncbi:MAG: GIY-YIG nuclease family protein [Methylococcales bacterium]|nr:GIY-YIG nuclease family protein [Methylococcales bacterium]
MDEKIKGYVYILEVKDIDLPVCKIGMTTRNPYKRCDEINNSSTGDFIWKVAHHIAVDHCKKLESLAHSKLAPLRQKRREFFNINAVDAIKALNSIFDSQSEIKKIEVEEEFFSKKKKVKRKQTFSRIDSEYTELLQLFTSLLNVKEDRPFGQLNQPWFGMSDGNEGV